MSMYGQLITPDTLPVPPARRRKPKPDKKNNKYQVIENPWRLTPAQCSILATLCKGWAIKEAAGILGLSAKTLSTQLNRACDTMLARNTMHACLLWDRWTRREQ